MLSGELVGRLNRLLGKNERELEFNAAACRWSKEYRGADIDNPYQSEGHHCLNLANRTERVGLEKLITDLGLGHEQLQSDSDLQLFLPAAGYDAEQHYYPNGAVAPVQGGYPGSTHSLAFGRDDQADFVNLRQTGSTQHFISTTLPTFTDGQAVTVECSQRIDTGGANIRFFYADIIFVSLQLLPSGVLRYWDGGAPHDSASSVTTLLSTTFPFVMEARVAVNGTALQVDIREPGGAWTSAITSTATARNWTGQTLYVGSGNSTEPTPWPIYSLGVRDGNTAAAFATQFTPDLFAAGNRGHAATATDPYGVEWAIARAGSPLSVIDTGDGRGKRVRFVGDSGHSLVSSSVPNLTDKDVFLWARMSHDQSASGYVIGQYDGAGQRACRLFVVTGQPFFQYSTDGTNGVSNSLTAEPSWWTSGRIGWIGAFYDHSAGDLIWYDGGEGETPSWSAIETDSIGTVSFFTSTDTVRIGNGAFGFMDGDLIQTGIGSSTSSLYDFAHFDAAHIDRNDWRLDRKVQGASATNTWAVSFTDSAEDANDPVQLHRSGADYLWLDGNTANGASLADDAAYEFTATDLFRAEWYGSLDDWASGSAQWLFTKMVTTGNQRSWALVIGSSGDLQFMRSTDGTAESFTGSTVLDVVDGGELGIAVEWDIDGGSNNLTFQISRDNGATWTTIETVTLATAPFDSTAPLQFGPVNVSGRLPGAGKYHWAKLYKNGTEIARIDPSDSAAGDGTSWTDSVSGNAVTISRATTAFAAAVVKQDAVVFGGSHWIDIPHHPDLDADPISTSARWRLHDTTSTWRMLLTKKADSSGNTVGYQVQRWNTDPRVFAGVADGVGNQATSSGNNITESTQETYGTVHLGTDQEMYVNGVSDASNTPALGSAANTNNVRVGADGAGTGGLDVGEFFGVAILSRRITDAEAAEFHTELAAA